MDEIFLGKSTARDVQTHNSQTNCEHQLLPVISTFVHLCIGRTNTKTELSLILTELVHYS